MSLVSPLQGLNELSYFSINNEIQPPCELRAKGCGDEAFKSCIAWLATDPF
jgi:hypothetical protein